ncbi:hypothetical protein [Actinospica robiniae]|uniref:hypothetical protein n=1 Tax=Actinospica robiniae TaxID=304901 RepID=UPI00041ED09E|nr:hypothetical protein [Actinospica robiniae]
MSSAYGLPLASLGLGRADWLRQSGALAVTQLNYDSRAVTFPSLGTVEVAEPDEEPEILDRPSAAFQDDRAGP